MSDQPIDPTNPPIHIDPSFLPVVQTVGPLDFSSLQKPIYVALIGAILGQRIPYAVAKKLRGRLYTALGTNFTYHQLDSWLHITTEIPADKLIIIRRLNAYLKQQPDDFLHTKENIESLQNLITGIGPWTIRTTLLVSGLDPDIFPSDDYFIQKRIQRLYNMKTTPTAAEVERISERWRPYRSYYAWYLWRWF